MLRLEELTSFYEKTGDTQVGQGWCKTSETSWNRKPRARRLFRNVCAHCAQITEEVFGGHSLVLKCVCVFWRCKCVTVWLCGKLSPVLRSVTLASCFCTLSEGKRRRCCFRWPFYHCLGLSLCAGRLPTGSILLWPLLFPAPQNTMSQSYTDTTQWLNTPNVNSAADKSLKPLAF